MSRARIGLLAAALLALAAAPQAPAREATDAELRELASAAAGGDAHALAALRRVDHVDGRASALSAYLEARGATLRSRLRALAARPARPATDAVTARRAARDVLAEDRFHEPSFPRPLRGVFAWAATTIDPVVDEVDALIDAVVPGGRPVGFTLLAVAVILGFAALSSRMVRLRARRRATAVAQDTGRSRGATPAELERAASEAERAGDLNLAVRLLFRAGLLRLDRRGAIRLEPSLTTAAIARRIDSADFAEVAAGFEEVAYGGRPAAPADIEAQRSGWRRVLGERQR